jgi:SOS-response transcriptional repressor LexA
MKYSLTKKQKKIFDFVKSYIQKNKEAPSYERIMRGVNLKSKNSVYNYVNQLKDRGWITTKIGKCKSMTLIK